MRRRSPSFACDHNVMRRLGILGLAVRQVPEYRRPSVGQFAFATPVLGAATCATARRETRRSRLPAIASASPWLPYPASPLARIIHIFEDNKSLLCYKHVD